jgi:hypothetical protein
MGSNKASPIKPSKKPVLRAWHALLAALKTVTFAGKLVRIELVRTFVELVMVFVKLVGIFIELVVTLDVKLDKKLDDALDDCEGVGIDREGVDCDGVDCPTN